MHGTSEAPVDGSANRGLRAPTAQGGDPNLGTHLTIGLREDSSWERRAAPVPVHANSQPKKERRLSGAESRQRGRPRGLFAAQGINVARREFELGAPCFEEVEMDKHVLVIAATAFVAWGASTAGAQDYPDYATREQPQVVQQRQELERQLERAQSPRRSVESDNDQDDGGGMMGRGWRYHQDWGRGMYRSRHDGQRGMMDRGIWGPA